jgi:hypothetical protein
MPYTIALGSDLPGRRHGERQKQYLKRIAKQYRISIEEATRLAKSAALSPDKPFRFNDYPGLKKKYSSLLSSFSTSLCNIVMAGTNAE